MSNEAATAEVAPSKTLDTNVKAADEAKKLLEELQGTAQPTAENVAQTTNGHTGETGSEEKAEEQTQTDKSDDRRQQRGDNRSSRGRGRGGHQSKSFRDNIKSDLTTQEESSDPVAIRKQVEFYFSDSNLPMDKFLMSKVGGRQNNAVELATIHSFKRMRHFQPFSAIIAALHDSTFLELVDDDTKVRRREPLPAAPDDPEAVRVFEDRAMPRSVYAKGFGTEEPSTQFDIEAFFKAHGDVNAVRLRRSDTKHFKGSVFVEFASEQAQQAFLALEPKPQYKGRDLSIMSKKDYCDNKVEDIKAGRIKPNDRKFKGRDNNNGRHGGGGRGDKRKRGDRDDDDSRDWRERRDDDRRKGFRGDRKGGRRRASPEYGASRDQVETDERGVPIVKSSADDKSFAEVKKDAATADALARAKAMVDAEQKKETKSHEATDSSSANVDAATTTTTANGEAASSKKRARDDDVSADAPETKKVDTKTAAAAVEAANGQG